jgi:hypothetical protein
MARIRVGISGWTYAGWRGDFYPRGLVQRRELEYAAERMTSIEINGSFYSLQRPTSYAAWRDQTPDDFVFAVKGGRFITHMKKLAGVETALANFFASGVLALGRKTGPFLWQLPPNLGFDADRLAAFFDLLPRTSLEAAELARGHDAKIGEDRALTGTEVTVVEMHDLPLQGVLGPEVARVFAGLHRDHGVDLRLGAGVDGIDGRADGTSDVRLTDGSSLPADLVVVGIGVQPEVGLARAAGLAVDDGVLVDARLRTPDPHVFAVGDIAGHDHPVLRRRVRVEHWDNAIHQARAAVRVMMGGDEPYERLPYFFTDQYDLGMEYVGSVGPDGYDEVVLRGDVEGRVFSAFWLRGGRVLAAMHANDWDLIDPIRGIVGREVDRARLADAAVPLDEVS